MDVAHAYVPMLRGMLVARLASNIRVLQATEFKECRVVSTSGRSWLGVGLKCTPRSGQLQ
jgi:hypothetical protein